MRIDCSSSSSPTADGVLLVWYLMMICSFGYATDGLVAFSFRSWEQNHRCRFLLWRAHTNFQMLAKGVTQKVKVQQLRPIIYIHMLIC